MWCASVRLTVCECVCACRVRRWSVRPEAWAAADAELEERRRVLEGIIDGAWLWCRVQVGEEVQGAGGAGCLAGHFTTECTQ